MKLIFGDPFLSLIKLCKSVQGKFAFSSVEQSQVANTTSLSKMGKCFWLLLCTTICLSHGQKVRDLFYRKDGAMMVSFNDTCLFNCVKISPKSILLNFAIPATQKCPQNLDKDRDYTKLAKWHHICNKVKPFFMAN